MLSSFLTWLKEGWFGVESVPAKECSWDAQRRKYIIDNLEIDEAFIETTRDEFLDLYDQAFRDLQPDQLNEAKYRAHSKASSLYRAMDQSFQAQFVEKPVSLTKAQVRLRDEYIFEFVCVDENTGQVALKLNNKGILQAARIDGATVPELGRFPIGNGFTIKDIYPTSAELRRIMTKPKRKANRRRTRRRGGQICGCQCSGLAEPCEDQTSPPAYS